MSLFVLNRKVLVLNKSWVACSVVSLRRAITLLFKDDATIIDPIQQFQIFTWDDWSKLRPNEGEDYLSTSMTTFRVPEVILLRNYDKLPFQGVNFSRRSLHRRDGNLCQYCGGQTKEEELTIDHVLPKSLGGRTSWDNCVSACRKCNSRKANRTPEQAGMKFYKPGFKPFKPKFNLFRGDIRIKSWEHFVD